MMTDRPILFSGPMVRAILENRKTQTRRPLDPQPRWVPGADWCAPFWDWVPYTGKNDRHPWFGFYTTEHDSETDEDFAEVAADYVPFKVGDRLWVRETWADVNSEMGPSLLYRADSHMVGWEDFSETFGKDYGAGPSMDYDTYPGEYCMWWSDLLAGEPDHKWKPSIHMPKWACRLWLRVTDVRVQRLQDITNNDAIAEGLFRNPMFDDKPEGPYWRGYCWDDNDTDRWAPTPKNAFRCLWDDSYEKGPYGSQANPWVIAITFEREE